VLRQVHDGNDSQLLALLVTCAAFSRKHVTRLTSHVSRLTTHTTRHTSLVPSFVPPDGKFKIAAFIVAPSACHRHGVLVRYRVKVFNSPVLQRAAADICEASDHMRGQHGTSQHHGVTCCCSQPLPQPCILMQYTLYSLSFSVHFRFIFCRWGPSSSSLPPPRTPRGPRVQEEGQGA